LVVANGLFGVSSRLSDDNQLLSGASLHCYLPAHDASCPLEAAYPNRPPLLFLVAERCGWGFYRRLHWRIRVPRFPFVSGFCVVLRLQACARLSIAASLYAQCWSKVGTGMLYDVMLGVTEDVGSKLTSHLTNTATHKHLFPSVAPVVVPSPSGSVPASSRVVTGTRGKPASIRPESQRKDDQKVSGESLASLRSRVSSQPPSEARERMMRERGKLPAAAAKDSILSALKRDQVVLISGQTGCGKTTQVPQFILDDIIGDPTVRACKIVCTQPRRLAAIGVANRVADERCEAIGGTIGYQIRGETRMSRDTCLVFCTTGVLLRQLQDGLGGVTHIIVDEVHERSVDTDFLLAVLKRMLPRHPAVKVVLMSATMEAATFARYFAGNGGRPCSVIEIPGRTFPVREVYLDDVLAVTDVPFQLPKRSELFPDCSGASEVSRLDMVRLPTFADALFARDTLDYNCLTAVVAALATGTLAPLYPASSVSCPFDPEGAILVFMPGVIEIRKLQRKLEDALSGWPVLIFPLHGNLTPDEQSQVFKRPPRGTRKIVLATNVAETSITIDDISVVVDTGRVKEMRYDPVSKTGHLKETWTSQDSSNQRRGRAGRVREGLCVRCYPSAMWAKLSRHTTPEILRTPLQSLCLQIKLLGLGAIHALLAHMIDAPAADAVTVAVNQLVDVGALQPSELHAHDHDLTALGRCIALLPVDVSAGKMLIYGVLLRCVRAMFS
jgi:HrpA-like RNA helicase